MFQTEVVAKKR